MSDDGGKVTSDNIYGDPGLVDQDWHVRHDNEIWTEDDRYVGECNNAPDAHHIIRLHQFNRKGGTSFWVIMDLDTGNYLPMPLGRNGRGSTHQDLVPAKSGLPPRLFSTKGGAVQSLNWWRRGRTSVSHIGTYDPFEGGETDESWHTEEVPERKSLRMDVVEFVLDL